MKEYPIYKDISAGHEKLSNLSKQTILGRMLPGLPDVRWADIGILEWLADDDKLPVEYSSHDTPFGEVLIASTPKGVCYLGVVNDESGYVYADFQKRFGYADPQPGESSFQRTALDYLNGKMDEHMALHLRGTPYQTGIWRRLLHIPSGKVITYATLAGHSAHARAAGAANGRNPVFYLVPCHRAVYSDGGSDRYSWGKDIKTRLLAWEFANSED